LIERYFRVPIELRDPRHNLQCAKTLSLPRGEGVRRGAPSATRSPPRIRSVADEARMLPRARTHYPSYRDAIRDSRIALILWKKV
jgi:hypothetical protein